MKATTRVLIFTGLFALFFAGSLSLTYGQSGKEQPKNESSRENTEAEEQEQIQQKDNIQERQNAYFGEEDEDQLDDRVRDLIPVSDEPEFQRGKIRVRINPGYRGQCTPQDIAISSIQQKLAPLGVTKIARSFPRAVPPSEVTDKYGRKYVDLSLIYEIEFNPDFPVEEAVKMLENDPAIQYVEPAWIMRSFYTPNDNKFPNQYHMGLIHAADAWDIEQGDSTIVIGIVDTGISFTHPDLMNKIAFNWNDPIDGIDNDNDGYIDNFRGWDFAGGGAGGPDNDPTYVGTDHGVLVGGAAGADTDNGWGVASTGFDCRILPIKVNRDNSSGVIFGYNGIVYAADHGAQIINCSWGSGAASNYGQNIIDYAVINKGCLVVAAAGNTPTFYNVYPAAFQNVLSVGGTMYGDEVWYDSPSFGTSWNYMVDIAAPAKNIRTTARHNMLWWGATGTSMAAPLVAGAAGLVKAQFPNLSMTQVGERIRVSADDIYGTNPTHKDLLGKGRLNMYSALTKTSPSIRLNQLTFADQNNNIPEGYDTLEVTADVYNWLDPTQNLTVEMFSMDNSYLEILSGATSIGQVNTLANGSNATPVRMVVKKPVDAETEVWVKLVYTDVANNYHDYEYTRIYLQPGSFDINENNVAVTISDDGNIGYTNSFPATDELGFRYKNSPSLIKDAGGFLIGASATQLSDGLAGSLFTPENDLYSRGMVEFDRNLQHTDLVVSSHFTDERNYANPLEVRVSQTVYADTKPEFDDFLIFEYLVKNEGSTDYYNLRSGLFTDWNMNQSDVDPDLNLLYAWNTDSTQFPYVGVVVLDRGNANLSTYDKGMFHMSKANKWDALDNMQSPSNQSGVDVLTFAASGSFDLMAGTETTVAFAMVGGDDLAQLKENAEAAWKKYHCELYSRVPVAPELGADIGLCPGETANLVADSGYVSYLWSTGHDGNSITLNQAGTYTLEVENEYFCAASDYVTVETFSAPTPDLGGSAGFCDGASATLTPGNGYASYQWSTGETTASISVNQGGSYSVTVENSDGCQGSSNVDVTPFPNIVPNLEDAYHICQGGAVSLDPGFGYVTHNWAHGPSTREIQVKFPGVYTVNLVDANGCTYSDQTEIFMAELPELDLGAELNACAGEVITLDPGTGFATYTWNDGTTGQVRDVSASGSYQVTAETAEGCTAEASVRVNVFPVPEVNLGGEMPLCQASELDCGIPNAAYLWSTGETTRSIWVEKSGIYEVQIYTAEGCQASDQVEVTLEKLSAGFEME